MMIKLRRLSRNKGFSFPWVVVVALIGIMMFTAVSQYIRLVIIASGVKDALQSAVIAASVENHGNVYPCIREGYAGGYKYMDGDWEACISTGDIYGRLSDLLSLEFNQDKYIKSNASGLEFAVYDLNVQIENSPISPSSANVIRQFEATSNITLEVPLSFGSEILPPMTIDLCVKSKYTPKF